MPLYGPIGLALLMLAPAPQRPAVDGPGAVRHLDACVTASTGDPAAECRAALAAGLSAANAGKAYTFLGLALQPDADLLARTFDPSDQIREAVRAYRAALAAWPQSALAALKLGDALHLLGENDALAAYTRAATLQPGWAAAHVGRAEMLAADKNYDEASRALEDAARVDPYRAAELLDRAGQWLAQAGNAAGATALFKRAANASPQDPALCLELGGNLLNSGQKSEAIAVLSTGVAHRTADASLISALGSSLARAGVFDQAIELTREAVRLAPRDGGHWRQLALVLRDAGRLDEAIDAQRRWQRVAPNDYVVLWDMGQTFEEAGRLPEAIDTFTLFYKRFPAERHEAAALLGDALVRAGRYAEAVPLLRESRDGWMAKENLAVALRHVGRLDEAAALDAEILEPARKEGSHMALASLLARLGYDEQALAEFEAEVREHPDKGDAHAQLAMALRKAGRHEEAVREFQQADRLDPLYLDHFPAMRRAWKDSARIVAEKRK